MEMSVDSGAYGAISEEFCRYKTASIAILPVPYDATSTWMKGSKRGFQALLDASADPPILHEIIPSITRLIV